MQASSGNSGGISLSIDILPTLQATNSAVPTGGVVSPNDPIETIHQVATAYRIEWLIIERANSVPALGPVFTDENRPGWIGQRLVGIPGADGQTAVAIYPICASSTRGLAAAAFSTDSPAGTISTEAICTAASAAASRSGAPGPASTTT